MVWQNSHATVVKRVENRVGKAGASKSCLDIVLSQNVNGTSRHKTGKTLRAYPVGFPFIHEREGVRLQFKGVGDRCGLPVVKCLSNGAGDQPIEMLHPSASKLHDLQSSRRLICKDRGSLVPTCFLVVPKFRNDL